MTVEIFLSGALVERKDLCNPKTYVVLMAYTINIEPYHYLNSIITTRLYQKAIAK